MICYDFSFDGYLHLRRIYGFSLVLSDGRDASFDFLHQASLGNVLQNPHYLPTFVAKTFAYCYSYYTLTT